MLHIVLNTETENKQTLSQSQTIRDKERGMQSLRDTYVMTRQETKTQAKSGFWKQGAGKQTGYFGTDKDRREETET